MARLPAHRRKRDPWRKAQLAPVVLQPIPRCPQHGKKAYGTEASAKLALKRHSAATYPTLLRPYFDEACQSWHLTSKPQREAS